MENDMTAVMVAAMEAQRNDRLFRAYVDSAVAEAMRHAEHIPEGEIEKRDLHHVAVAAAMAVLRQAIDGNHLLKSMEFERDAANKMALNAAHTLPTRLLVREPGL